ncbi:hypothetical protein [Flavobacterium agrisoli]|uniref:Uncharacterized protein n=1 Tax=Flavobacterium agrisoli TaxID=2793066 RepID=A0A934PKS0_9FLAO|nr:hypothetical protein [Flavobacterium agrisoli]MBK0369144.1 hypothetical protein [Flavobacterium agrisoli]
MKELDLLKKDWKKNENAFNQLSEIDIYKMLHQKSSSIVQWIFIISLIEFVFWIGISLLFDTDTYLEENNRADIVWYLHLFDVLNYSIILVFIYLFYKNYRTISTSSSTKLLMQSILKTRKIVQLYVWYNLGMLLLGSFVGVFIAFTSNPKWDNFNESFATQPKVTLISIAILVVVIAGLMGILWGIYRLIYGRLLRRLFANYKELKKIDF